MSHVAVIDVECKDLKALDKACQALGLVLLLNQRTYRWYGRSVGDYPIPAGLTAADLGRCDHAIAIPNDSRAYQIGVVKRRDGKPGYQLLWDFYAGGYGMEAKVGKDAIKLRDRYAAEVAGAIYRKKGYRVKIQQQADDTLELVATR